MSPLGGGRSGRQSEPRAEYVAAGGDLALVRVSGAAEPPSELLVFAGGRVHSFEPLPGAPGDDRTGFPVPLDLVTGTGSKFRLVAGDSELGLPRPQEAPPAKPSPPTPPPTVDAA